MERNFLDELARYDTHEFFTWLTDKRLIRLQQQCSHCNFGMNFKLVTSTSDKCVFRCINPNCTKYETTLSIRTGSMLSRFKIPLKVIIKTIFLWSKGFMYADIVEQANISSSCFVKLKYLLIERIKIYYEQNPIKLGGAGRIVQVDETMLNHKVKSHKGRSPTDQTWCLTIIDTSFKPAKGYAKIIQSKSRDVIFPIICEVVRDYSTIYTDEARVYNTLEDLGKGYIHKVVKHKDCFVDPVTGVHTQNVESSNGKIKKRIKDMYGVEKNKREDFIYEFLFLDSFKNTTFEKILECLKVELTFLFYIFYCFDFLV